MLSYHSPPAALRACLPVVYFTPFFLPCDEIFSSEGEDDTLTPYENTKPYLFSAKVTLSLIIWSLSRKYYWNIFSLPINSLPEPAPVYLQILFGFNFFELELQTVLFLSKCPIWMVWLLNTWLCGCKQFLNLMFPVLSICIA